jgi:hypothetical protein
MNLSKKSDKKELNSFHIKKNEKNDYLFIYLILSIEKNEQLKIMLI